MVATRNSLPTSNELNIHLASSSPSQPPNSKLKAALRKLQIDGKAALVGDARKPSKPPQKTSHSSNGDGGGSGIGDVHDNGQEVQTYHYRGATYLATGKEPGEWIEGQPKRYLKSVGQDQNESKGQHSQSQKKERDQTRHQKRGKDFGTKRKRSGRQQDDDQGDDDDDAEPRPSKRRPGVKKAGMTATPDSSQTGSDDDTPDRSRTSRLYDYAAVGSPSQLSCIQAQRAAAEARGYAVQPLPAYALRRSNAGAPGGKERDKGGEVQDVEKRLGLGVETAKRVCRLAKLNERIARGVKRLRAMGEELAGLDRPAQIARKDGEDVQENETAVGTPQDAESVTAEPAPDHLDPDNPTNAIAQVRETPASLVRAQQQCYDGLATARTHLDATNTTNLTAFSGQLHGQSLHHAVQRDHLERQGEPTQRSQDHADHLRPVGAGLQQATAGGERRSDTFSAQCGTPSSTSKHQYPPSVVDIPTHAHPTPPPSSSLATPSLRHSHIAPDPSLRHDSPAALAIYATRLQRHGPNPTSAASPSSSPPALILPTQNKAAQPLRWSFNREQLAAHYHAKAGEGRAEGAMVVGGAGIDANGVGQGYLHGVGAQRLDGESKSARRRRRRRERAVLEGWERVAA